MKKTAPASPASFTLSIRVIPSAPITRFIGRRAGELVIKLNAPAEAGKANRELVSFLARVLGIARRDITLVRGVASRHKIIALPAAAKTKATTFFSVTT
jgi:uncharacterized protein (TIGR00251 family)